MARNANAMDMVNGPLWGKILKFSVLYLLTALLQQLYSAADVIVVKVRMTVHAYERAAERHHYSKAKAMKKAQAAFEHGKSAQDFEIAWMRASLKRRLWILERRITWQLKK